MNLYISSDYIIDYLTERFKSTYTLCSDGMEMIIPSIFVDNDYKKHMSINTETGLWQCFKTGNKGNFIYLVSILEGKTYKQVYNDLLWKMIESDNDEKDLKDFRKEIQNVFKLDNNYWVPINNTVKDAWNFLISRGLDPEGNTFYYNKKSNRVVIPYRDALGNIFYYQERALTKEQQPKYLNSKGVKSSTILYQYDVDSFRGLYICEGAIDAITLKSLGLNATTTLSCTVSREQMSQLKAYNGKLIVAYDNDEAGLRGLQKFDRMRKRSRIDDLYYCTPPKEYKDWNEFYVAAFDPHIVKNYISQNTKQYDDILWAATQL